MRTRAEPNADEVVAGQINDKDSLDFMVDRADVGGVNEIDGKSEAFEGGFLKEIAIPQLGAR